ncbi:MAG: MbnP family protein [Bacteroidota bacterium]|nr:MbnP family protein [Bacteroidota bacterium]
MKSTSTLLLATLIVVLLTNFYVGDPNKGTFQLAMEVEANSKPFRFNTFYENPLGETYNVGLLKYYISNIKLGNTDGSEANLPNTYFLIDAESRNAVQIKNIPQGQYNKLSFVLGIDSAKTKQGGYAGDLDPINGMFWNTWGVYINWMMNGYYKTPSKTVQPFEYHIGGIEKPYSTTQLISVDFGGQTLKIGQGIPKLALSLDVQKFFQSTHAVSLHKTPVVSGIGDSAKIVSENFRHMFQFKHIQP